MQQFWPTFILAVVTAGFLFLMWRSWRRGKNEYATTSTNALTPLSGTSLASFNKVLYVSTNKAGQPLVRAQYPGLRYRGYADIDVLGDGLRVKVAGEETVEIAADQIDDTNGVQMRIGKVVEKNGLAAIAWHAGEEHLESSFRFRETTEQIQFMKAVKSISPSTKNVVNTESE